MTVVCLTAQPHLAAGKLNDRVVLTRYYISTTRKRDTNDRLPAYDPADGSVSRFTPEEKEEVRKQIAFYREVEPLILKGDLYRLLNPFEDASRAAQILVAKDKSAAFVDYLQLFEESHPAHVFLRLKGLDENKRYRISGTDEVYYGKTLMDCGLRFTLGSEHGKAKMFLLKEVK